MTKRKRHDRNRQIRDVRQNTDMSLDDIGKMFCVSLDTVWRICKGLIKGKNLSSTFIITVDGKPVTLYRRY